MTSPFGFKRAHDSPGFMLWQTTTNWQKLIKEALTPYGISHSQFVIMAITHFHNIQDIKVHQSLISSFSKLDKMTISKNIKELSRKALLELREDASDSRAKNVKLTVDGQRLIQKLVPIVEKIDEEFFGKLGGKDQKSLLKMFGVLAK